MVSSISKLLLVKVINYHPDPPELYPGDYLICCPPKTPSKLVIGADGAIRTWQQLTPDFEIIGSAQLIYRNGLCIPV